MSHPAVLADAPRARAGASHAVAPLRPQTRHFHLPPGEHYLNCAYGAPLLRDVAAASRQALRLWATPHALTPATYSAQADEARGLFARLIGAPDGEQVAVVPGVGYGIALAARNVQLRRDANVVIAAGQFPSNVYAWRRRCRETGAELRVVARPDRGADAGSWSERIVDAIDARTAVAALGTIDWTDGTLFDLEAIGARTRDVGAAYVLDGVQSIGALPFDVERVRPDLLACASYKWLLGPMGVGLCWVGERFADAEPLEETWLGRAGSEDFSRLTEWRDDYQPGARRFDSSGRAHFVLLPMLVAALRRLVEWTPARIQQYCCRLTMPALDELAEIGMRPPAAEPAAAHLFALEPPSRMSIDAMREALLRHRVHVSVRGGCLRVAPNVYNRKADMDALVAALCTVGSDRARR